ncbi:protein tumorous imaginal discs, mitochondrial [Tetranychus urticae]|uniref:J domain-containing protein n=1 Tax=Tetranychus urticae TaxID=32264 RepID=T1JVH4_TETUR|nr:protein tumorous imaginal discs, mitochondrial [Tetranychus urticae]
MCHLYRHHLKLLTSARVIFNFQQQSNISTVFGFKKRKNYYEILGVSRGADKKEIKKNYIKLAKLYHPDSTSSKTASPEKFQELLEAYQVLTDDEKRAKYDAEVLNDLSSEYQKHESAKDFSFMRNTVNAESLFRNIFGDIENPYANNQVPKEEKFAGTIWGFESAESLIIPLTIEQAAKGCKHEMEIRTIDTCYMCDGARSAYGFRATLCPFCDENGLETISTEPVVCKIKCRACGGSREYIRHLCPDCEGKGYQVQQKMASFNIPPGVRDGEVLKLVIRDQTILITCRIKPDDYFSLQGYDIHTQNEISISQAVLGGKTSVRGIYTTFNVDIPAGTSSHDAIAFKNGGWPQDDGSYGNHIVHFVIKVPVKLSRNQKQIWQQYAELEEDTIGTIDGIANTTEGKKFIQKEENVGILTRIKRALFG